mgnify:FL=1
MTSLTRLTPHLVAVAITLAVAACATRTPPVERANLPEQVILISIDGFHPGYLNQGSTPVLDRLAAEGANGAMRPSWPSVTFPNHYTLVTGLHPDHHGIVSNRFFDPDLGTFTMARKETAWWDQAEPIWVTAEKSGVR